MTHRLLVSGAVLVALACAALAQDINVQVRDVTVQVQGKTPREVTCVEVLDNLLIPVREVGELVGALVDYSNGGIKLALGNRTVELHVGSAEGKCREGDETKPFSMSFGVIEAKGMCFVPLRDPLEHLGVTVDYANGAVGLTPPGSAQASNPTEGGLTISDLHSARDISNNHPVNITEKFSPPVKVVHVTFNFQNAQVGTVFSTKLFYGGAEQHSFRTSVAVDDLTNPRAVFTYSFTKPAPPGEYRAQILSDGKVLGEARFWVTQ